MSGGTSARRRRRRVLGAWAVAGLFVVSACSGGDDGDGGDGAVTSATASTDSSGETSTSGEPSTSSDQEPIASGEFYAALGFDDTEIACIEASPLDADIITEPTFGDDTPIAIHIDGANAPVIANPGVASVYDIERQILEALIVDCAPAAKLDALAAANAEATMAEFDDELARHLNARTSDGATPEEVGCLDQRFRAAPARLVGVAASPQAVEAACASDERRADWRSAALRRGLAAAGADQRQVECLLGSQDDLDRLEVDVDALLFGMPGDLAGTDGACASAAEFERWAERIAADGSSFGVERLGLS